MARCAATVSVEKYGSPAPAPKITTRPFSMWRMARRGMYASATWPMVMALCTRVSTPACSRKSCSARQFMTVPSMPMYSARARSRPFWASSAPRKKLPPPQTMATCTPSATAAAISAATRRTTPASRPIDPPPNASPDSFSSTRRGSVSVMGYLQGVGGVLRGSRAGGPGPSGPGPPGVASSGADAEPHEAGHGAADLGEHLGDRLLRVLRERLVQEDDVLEVARQAALDDLRQRGLGLALVAGGLLGDAALVLDRLGRDLVAGQVGRRERGDVRRDVAGHLGALGVGRDEHADLRGEVLVHLVQVDGDLLAGDAGHAAHDDLLAEHGGRLVDDLLQRLAVDVRGEQRVGVTGAGGDRRGEHLLRQRDERGVLGDEVRLRVHLDDHADLVLAVAGGDDLGRDQAVGGRAALALGDALQALDADDLERLVGVALRLLERLLDVHHARAGLLAERLDVGHGVVGHLFRPNSSVRAMSGPGHLDSASPSDSAAADSVSVAASAAASAITRVSSCTARIASSLPGIG